MEQDNLIIVGFLIALLGTIAFSIHGCNVTERKFIEAGYTKQVYCSSNSTTWAK